MQQPSASINQPGPTGPNAMAYPIDYRCTRGDAPYNQTISPSVAPVPVSGYMNAMDQQLYSVEMVNPSCMCQTPYQAPFSGAQPNMNANLNISQNPMVMAPSKSCGTKCACRSSNRSPPKLERISPPNQYSNSGLPKLERISPIYKPKELSSNRCHCQSEDEYFSLSSSDRDEPGPSNLFNNDGKLEFSNPLEQATRTSEARNAVILQLLQEIVHLIDDNEPFCGPNTYTGFDNKDLSPDRMRKIGATNERRSDDGPFTSSIKITFCPSRKGTSTVSQDTEPTELNQAMAIPHMPCNLFITPCPCSQHPFYMTPLSGQHNIFPPPAFPPIPNTNQTLSSWKPGVETINYPIEKAIDMRVPGQEFMGDVISPDFIRPDELRHSENVPSRFSTEQTKYEMDMHTLMPSGEPQYDDEYRRTTGSAQQEFKRTTGNEQESFNRPTGSVQQELKRPTGSVQQHATGSIQQGMPHEEQNYEQSVDTQNISSYLEETNYERSDFDGTQYDEKQFGEPHLEKQQNAQTQNEESQHRESHLKEPSQYDGKQFGESHFEEQQNAQTQYEESQHRESHLKEPSQYDGNQFGESHFEEQQNTQTQYEESQQRESHLKESSHFTQNEDGQQLSYGEENLRTTTEQETIFDGDEQTPHIHVRDDLYDNAEGKPERISFAEEVGTDSYIGDDSDIICEEDDEICKEEQALRRVARRKSKKHDRCDCCHCRAVRENNLECMTIATPEQAKLSPAELKFFIDSILMDLEAMEHARRKKQIEQNTCPPKRCPLGERVSFPVTITEVCNLGASSLFVKWCIHDCFGIGGYEIYVDGYLTNRYFHCNHEAAVVCDVDVTKTHKIVLVAQPRTDDGADGQNKCKALLRKSDVDNGPSALWTPSIYLYEPSQLREPDPIVRLGS